MNKRQIKKHYKDCTSCKWFEGWENFLGQYDEYGRCEFPPSCVPNCKYIKSMALEFPIDVYFPDWIWERTRKLVCRHWKRK